MFHLPAQAFALSRNILRLVERPVELIDWFTHPRQRQIPDSAPILAADRPPLGVDQSLDLREGTVRPRSQYCEAQRYCMHNGVPAIFRLECSIALQNFQQFRNCGLSHISQPYDHWVDVRPQLLVFEEFSFLR